MSTTVKDLGWKALKKELSRMRAMELVVGVLDSEVATYGAYNEFGTKNIPARPFMRNTMTESGSDIAKRIKRAADRVMSGSKAYDEVTAIGLHVQGLIQKMIRSGIGPENAPSTIRQKGHSQTLRGGKKNGLAGGRLMKSISFEIR